MRKAMLGAMTLAMLLASATAGVAEVVRSPARALELLTEARVAAEKCGWLTAGERRELLDFAARAELEAVRREGAAAARAAVRQGRANGAASCSARKRERVLAVLQGAREAIRRVRAAAAPRPQPRRAAVRRTAARRLAMPHAARSRRAVAVQATARLQRAGWSGPVARIRQSAGGDVERYRQLAAAYYHALKCRNRPQAQLVRMWREVRDLHYAILGSGRKAALARAKERARREGTARACR